MKLISNVSSFLRQYKNPLLVIASSTIGNNQLIIKTAAQTLYGKEVAESLIGVSNPLALSVSVLGGLSVALYLLTKLGSREHIKQTTLDSYLINQNNFSICPQAHL